MHVIQVPYVRFLKITKQGEINLVLYIIGMLPLYGMMIFFVFIYFLKKQSRELLFFKILVPIH